MKIISIASSSLGCCYLVDFGKHQIILESGVSVDKIRRAEGFDFSKVAACLVSHVHQDHCKYVPEISKLAIPIFSTEEVSERFHSSIVNIIEPGESLRINNNLYLEVHGMTHDAQCLGFEVQHYKNVSDSGFMTKDEVLLYVTDTGELEIEIPGLTHLMIETNYAFDLLVESTRDKSSLGRVFDGHLEINIAIEFAKKHLKTLKQIYLLHLSDAHSDAERFQSMMARATGVPVYIADK